MTFSLVILDLKINIVKLSRHTKCRLALLYLVFLFPENFTIFLRYVLDGKKLCFIHTKKAQNCRTKDYGILDKFVAMRQSTLCAINSSLIALRFGAMHRKRGLILEMEL